MNNPLVSIIINNFNYEKFISQSIESCLNQSYRNIEVIVVDDGSTDDSRSIIQSFMPKIFAVFQSNAGQASTLNSGFKRSKGDIILCLDSDDLFVENKVYEIVSTYNRNPEIRWCFNALKLIDSITNEALGLSLESQSKFCDFREELQKGYLPFYPPSTSGLSFRRELLEKILPMPEEIGMYDRYLTWCALRLSPGYFIEEPLTLRLVHTQNHSGINPQSRGKKGPEYNNTKAFVSSAYFVRKKFPDMALFCNRKFATGFGLNWWTSNDELANSRFIDAYFSQVNFLELIYIYLIALYKSRPWRVSLNARTASQFN